MKEQTNQKAITDKKIGLFLCSCGDSLATAQLADTFTGQGIKVYTHNLLCSQAGQDTLAQTISQEELDQVIIAACSPQEHGDTFTKQAIKAGLSPQMVTIANVREQGYWVTPDPAKAQAKAKKIIQMAVGKLSQSQDITIPDPELTTDVLVVGISQSSLTAALNLADLGHKVTVIDDRETYQTEGLDTPTEDTINKATASQAIDIMMSTKVVDFSGDVGNFTVELRGAEGRITKTFGAVLIGGNFIGQVPQEAVPAADKIQVLTQGQLARDSVLIDQLLSQGDRPQIAFCLDIGTDDPQLIHTQAMQNAWEIVKTAKAKGISADIYYLSKNARTAEQGLEQLYARLRQSGVIFIRSEQNRPRIVSGGQGVKITVSDITISQTGEPVELVIPVDALIVGEKLTITPGQEQAARLMNLNLKTIPTRDSFGEMINIHQKSILSNRRGVYLVGSGRSPQSREDYQTLAELAAAEIDRLLTVDGLTALRKDTAVVIAQRVDDKKCAVCLTCVRMCPHAAIIIFDGGAQILPNSCYGCGACSGECPARAIQLKNYTDDQLVGQIRAVMQVG